MLKEKSPGELAARSGARKELCMQTNIFPENQSQIRFRAIVEIIGDEPAIFPIADSDAESAPTLHALRFIADSYEHKEARR
jgi:hypothetical protein